MKVASSIVLNIERARETGELDLIILWQLDFVVKLARSTILTISQKFNTVWSLLSLKVNEWAKKVRKGFKVTLYTVLEIVSPLCKRWSLF